VKILPEHARKIIANVKANQVVPLRVSQLYVAPTIS
jgi:hypothetical protein